jgi:rsbT co-antagonist protein RsbR
MNEHSDRAYVGVPSDVAHSDAALAVSRMDGVLMHVSDGYCALVGKPRDQLIGRRADEAGVSTPHQMRWILDRAPEIGRAHAFRRRFESPQGVRSVETIIHRLSEDMLAATLTPVDEADQLGPAPDDLLASILEAVPVGVVFYDRDLRIVRINRAIEEMGRIRPEHLGASITDAFADADAGVVESIRRVIASGEQIANKQVARDGRSFLLNFFPIRDAAGAVDQVGCLVSDVTAFIQAHELIQAQKEAIRELTTPILEVDDRVLAVPLVGAMDADRVAELTGRLLPAIGASRAHAVIIDVTGVPVIDSTVAHDLMNTAAAARLMGADVIMSGVPTEHAGTVAELGVDIQNIRTVASLADAIAAARAGSGQPV